MLSVTLTLKNRNNDSNMQPGCNPNTRHKPNTQVASINT